MVSSAGSREIEYKEDAMKLLREGARDAGIVLSKTNAEECLVYLTELNKWNRKINLTAITDEREVIIKHFVDSFFYCRGFEPRQGLKLLDMGSGAGFPALPMKIAFSEIDVTLVESVKKKSSFLRHIVRALKLKGVEVVDQRTDHVSEDHECQYDVVTARAFADMVTVFHEGKRFLKPGGVMVLSRGPEETVSSADIIASGFVLESRFDIVLPFSDYHRALWVFRKDRNVPRGT